MYYTKKGLRFQASCDSCLLRVDCERHLAAYVRFAIMLSLTCYLLGDDVKRYFVVEIEETKAVSILKDLIKEKKAPHLDHVSASDLEIWKVDLSMLNLKKGLEEIELNDDNSLSQGQRLSKVFSNLVSGHIHVIAKAPGTSRQSSFSETTLNPSKSDQDSRGS